MSTQFEILPKPLFAIALWINKRILNMIKMHYLYFVIILSVFSITMTSFQTFAVEEIWQDYDTMGEMVKDIKNGVKDDDNVDYNKFRNSTVYKNATEDVRSCIDLANKVGEELGDYEIVHCFENTNYFKEKYVEDEDVQNTAGVNRQGEDNQNMTLTKSVSNGNQEQEQKQLEAEQSTSDTSTSKIVKRNILINELIETGKFTEDEAKEFASQNMPNGIDITSSQDGAKTNETQSASINEQQREQVDQDQNQTQTQMMVNSNQTQIFDLGSNSTENCDPSYPDICITTYSSKLICSDIPFRNFKVILPDPHGFDVDEDGIGCEE